MEISHIDQEAAIERCVEDLQKLIKEGRCKAIHIIADTGSHMWCTRTFWPDSFRLVGQLNSAAYEVMKDMETT